MGEAVGEAVGEIDAITARLLSVFDDPEVDELLLNGRRGAWLVTASGTRPYVAPFADGESLADWLLDFAAARQVRLDPVAGSAGGSLLDDSFRWQAVLPPLSRDGPLLALRRHRFGKLRLMDFGGSPDLKARLHRAFNAGRPLLIAGPTGSGKTSLLAALLGEWASQDRVVVIESTAELPAVTPFCIRLLERGASIEGARGTPPIGMKRLVAEALRLRPDRLVIGEIRGSEAEAFLDAARTGHGGAVATIHAEDVHAARARLAELARCRPDQCSGVAVAMMARGQPPLLVDVDSDIDSPLASPLPH